MLVFVYLAYSMMALLMESVPSLKETWIECLGDLARYRMAIEEANLRDREVWSGVARMWYNKAAGKSPNVDRILPYMHVIPAYLFGLAFVPNALIYVKGCVPWENIAIFLNTLGRSGVVEAHFEGTEFPQQMSGTGRQLPEDFVMRGLIWAQHCFPADFFNGQVVDDDGRSLELPYHGAPRTERCLWLDQLLTPFTAQVCFISNGHTGRITASWKVHGPENLVQHLSCQVSLSTSINGRRNLSTRLSAR